jgi:hypothetical protein
MNILQKIADQIINPAIFLLFALALLYFLYGVVIYIQNADSPEKRKEGGRHMIYGILGFVIMFGVYGIMRILQNTLLSI